MKAKCAALLLASLFTLGANAADLQPETLNAWHECVDAANCRMQQRLRPGAHFLWIDEQPGRSAKLRRGEVVISPMGPHTPKKVPFGLIHDWIGAVFIPNATIADVLSVVRDYNNYKEFYRPTVIDSKALQTEGSDDRFSMLLMNKALFLKTALDSEYESSYVQLDGHRSYSLARTIRVQEIQHYGEPGASKLADGHGSGLIWRLSSITRFEERDGGVYVELEAIALSRDIPASLRWLVDPIVRRISKASLITSLKQTSSAVQSSASS